MNQFFTIDIQGVHLKYLPMDFSLPACSTDLEQISDIIMQRHELRILETATTCTRLQLQAQKLEIFEWEHIFFPLQNAQNLQKPLECWDETCIAKNIRVIHSFKTILQNAKEKEKKNMART